MKTIATTITMPDEMNAQLMQIAKKMAIPKTSLIKVIIQQYFEAQKQLDKMGFEDMTEQFSKIVEASKQLKIENK